MEGNYPQVPIKSIDLRPLTIYFAYVPREILVRPRAGSEHAIPFRIFTGMVLKLDFTSESFAGRSS
jgi:hypothetical protein